MRRAAVLLVVVSCALVSGCKKSEMTRAPIAWRRDVDAALADASKQHKGFIVYADADWDVAYPMMERETFSNARVRKLFEDFMPIFIDESEGDEDPRIAPYRRSFDIIGVPALIVYDAERNERARFLSVVRPEQLIPTLEDARRGKKSALR